MGSSTDGRGGFPLPAAVDGIELAVDEFRAVAEAARWSPSINNSQPWAFRRLPAGLGVLEDLGRCLPITDPLGRDRTISCGAALFNARTAMRALGHLPAVEVLPDPAEPTLVGTVRSTGHREPSGTDAVLHRMIMRRRTHRRVYRSHAVAEEDLLDLRQAVAAEGARLSVAQTGVRRRLAHLLHHHAARPDTPDAGLREVDRPDGPGATAEIEQELARSTFLVVSTRDDSRRDWVVAGMALERLLLVATSKSLVATFADQALQVPGLREEIADTLAVWGHPQVLFRIGRPLVEAPRTSRRPLDQILSEPTP